MAGVAPLDLDILGEMIGTSDPERVREVTQLFAKSSIRMLGELRKAWEKADMEALLIAAHGLKGAARTVGANPVASIMAALEDGLRRKVPGLPIGEALADLQNELNRLLIWLRRV